MTPSAIYVLGMLPLGVFGLAALAPCSAGSICFKHKYASEYASPIAPIAVATEGITERRQDDQTFRRRWPIDLPPAVIVREVSVIAVAPEAAAPAPRVAPVVTELRPVRSETPRLHAARPTDVCARHRMRRVDYVRNGRPSWRCRR